MNFDGVVAALANEIAAAVVERLGVAQTDSLIRASDTGIPKRTRSRLIATGVLPARKLGREWFVRRSDVLALPVSVPKQAEPAGTTPEPPWDEFSRRVKRTSRARRGLTK